MTKDARLGELLGRHVGHALTVNWETEPPPARGELGVRLRCETCGIDVLPDEEGLLDP